MTRKQKVLDMLKWRADVGLDEGWVEGWELCVPEVGGSEGLRRVRELRADGHVIEMRSPVKGRASRQYRLVRSGQLSLDEGAS